MNDILGGLRERETRLLKQLNHYIDEAEGRGDTEVGQNYHDAWADLEKVQERIADIEKHEAHVARVDAARAPYERLVRPSESVTGSGFRAMHGNVPALPNMAEYRVLSEGTAGAGGYLVPEKQSAQWLDYLRKKSVVLSAGPKIIPITSDNVHIPKVASSVTVSMIAENAAITPSDPTFAEVVLSPKNVAAFTLASRQVFDDSTDPSVREVVAADFLASIADKLDQQFLAGTGANNMTGMRNMSGPTITYLGANGAVPTIDNLFDAVARLEASNANPATSAWFMHSRTLNQLRKVKDLQNRYLLAPDPANDVRLQIAGIPIYVSNNVSITETRGSNTDSSYILLADMSQILIGQRMAVELAYSEDYAFNAFQVAIRGFARYDIGLANNGGLEIIAGVTLS